MTDATELIARIARLEAIHEIERLSADYCRGADRRDAELFLSVWAPDGVWQVRDDLQFVGAAQIEQGVRTQWSYSRRAFHWTSNARIDVEGDRASATFDVDAQTQLLDGSWLAIGGAYVDTFVRHGSTWKIASRRAEIYSQRGVKSDTPE